MKANQPFTECEQEDFVELLKSINPEVKPISAQTVKRAIISTFEEKISEIKSRLRKVTSKFAFTIDCLDIKKLYTFYGRKSSFY